MYKKTTKKKPKEKTVIMIAVGKMKPKKKMRRKQGFRKEITRIIIDQL